MHARFRRHTIDNVKRVVVVQGSDTTDAHCRSTRGRTISRDVHTRNTPLHRLYGVVLILLRQFGHAHHADSTRKIGFTLCGVTGYHNLIERQRIVLHRNTHAISSRHLHIKKSDIREHQRFPSSNLQREITVEVGYRSVRRAFLHHCGANNRLTCLVDDISSDCLLRVHYST